MEKAKELFNYEKIEKQTKKIVKKLEKEINSGYFSPHMVKPDEFEKMLLEAIKETANKYSWIIDEREQAKWREIDAENVGYGCY